MKFIQLLLAATLFAAGCQSKTSSEQNHADHGAMLSDSSSPVATLEGQVLAVHDSIMPQMSELMTLQEAVAKKAGTASADEKTRGLAIETELRKADKGMMDWMHGYNRDTLKKLDEAKALDYLKAEQTKINAVRDQMLRSMADAKRYVAQ